MEIIRIHVKEFGRVRDSQLDIFPFVIFSGESGLGKSYMALLCHYFYEVLVNTSRLSHFFEQRGSNYQLLSKDFHNEGTALGIRKEELEKWLAEDAINYVGMMLGNTSLKGTIDVDLPFVIPATLTFRFKEELTGLVNDEDVNIVLSIADLNYRVTEAFLGEESPFSFLLRYALIKYIFSDFRALENTIVLPLSRGPVLTESLIPQTGIYFQFLQALNRISPRKDSHAKKLQQLLHDILEGDIERIDNKYVYKTGNVEIPISAAAASIREIAPLELFVKRGDIVNAALLFEEPEAHLHPLKQRMMADILSALANTGTFMQVTTHSDYLISRLNELIVLNEIREKEQDESAFNEFCKELDILPELCLSTENLAAYVMERREDGFSTIKQKADVKGKEISYLTFSTAIENSMRVQRKLEEKLAELEER